jgi:hypothetical protein
MVVLTKKTPHPLRRFLFFDPRLINWMVTLSGNAGVRLEGAIWSRKLARGGVPGVFGGNCQSAAVIAIRES